MEPLLEKSGLPVLSGQRQMRSGGGSALLRNASSLDGEMLVCDGCGQRNRIYARFCGGCGISLTSSAPALPRENPGRNKPRLLLPEVLLDTPAGRQIVPPVARPPVARPPVRRRTLTVDDLPLLPRIAVQPEPERSDRPMTNPKPGGAQESPAPQQAMAGGAMSGSTSATIQSISTVSRLDVSVSGPTAADRTQSADDRREVERCRLAAEPPAQAARSGGLPSWPVARERRARTPRHDRPLPGEQNAWMRPVLILGTLCMVLLVIAPIFWAATFGSQTGKAGEAVMNWRDLSAHLSKRLGLTAEETELLARDCLGRLPGPRDRVFVETAKILESYLSAYLPPTLPLFQGLPSSGALLTSHLVRHETQTGRSQPYTDVPLDHPLYESWGALLDIGLLPLDGAAQPDAPMTIRAWNEVVDNVSRRFGVTLGGVRPADASGHNSIDSRTVARDVAALGRTLTGKEPDVERLAATGYLPTRFEALAALAAVVQPAVGAHR